MTGGLVSVIIPAYNAEKYIENTIESVEKQTYDNIEIIVVNDGSTDNTGNVLSNLKSKFDNLFVYEKENQGVTLARKYGALHSNGEYIGFVDADDELDPRMYEILVDNLLNNDADISHCGYDVIDLNGKMKLFYGTEKKKTYSKIDGITALLSNEFEPGLCNKLYKRELIINLFEGSLLDYSIKINEDLLMNYYLFSLSDTTCFHDLCLYHYLKRDGSASTSKLNHNLIWDQIKVLSIIRSDSFNTEYEKTARKKYLLRCINIYNTLSLFENKAFVKDRNEVKSLISENKKDFCLLGKKNKCIANTIMYLPFIYSLIYNLFSKVSRRKNGT